MTLPPIVQGTIERDPLTLGELHETFLARGVDLIDALRKDLQQRVGGGTDRHQDDVVTVFLIQTPIMRHAGALPERIQHRAFIILEEAFKLGIAIGALFEHEGKIYSETSLWASTEPDTWKSLPLLPMEVLHANTSQRARAQSGINEEGPVGVLIGAGSLGSALLNLWGRSGWGTWTVIDKDHIKPHNLSRHTAIHGHIGAPKVDVVAHLHRLITDGASQIEPICADACDIDHAQIRTALRGAKLIVDASTTLEYPRLASKHDDIGRHVSVFITPGGNSAVMLLEDAERRIRLRTLEAQYYRSVLNEPWGATHLPSELGNFWSGASCRDISSVLPYSRIISHSGILADQIHKASIKVDPAIRIWSADSETGAVAAYSIHVFAERSIARGSLEIFIDEGLELKLRSIREATLPCETGGVLLGYHDFDEGYAVIVDALSAPSDSGATQEYFMRGIDGLKNAVSEASRRTAGIVGYMGEWHSHPRGHGANPSGQDIIQLAYLTASMDEDGLPAIQLIVGDRDMTAIVGKVRQ